MTRKLEIIPQSAALGAELRGVDLGRPLDEGTAIAIRHAFLEHQVIFFRNQSLGPHQLLAVARCFGSPVEYPFAEGIPECPLVTEIVKEPQERINFGGEWHSDTTYLKRPPCATLLYAVEVPAAGGDTLYSDMYRAYARLSPGMQTMLARLRAVNTAALLGREKRDGYASVRAKNVDRLSMRAEHPVVRTHPETGRKALYINETHTLHFRGMTREESLPPDRAPVPRGGSARARIPPSVEARNADGLGQPLRAALRAQRLPRKAEGRAPGDRRRRSAAVAKLRHERSA